MKFAMAKKIKVIEKNICGLQRMGYNEESWNKQL